MPVIGSSFVFRWAIVHDGVIRRSDEEAVEVIKSGMSRVVAMTDVRQDPSRLAWQLCEDGI